MEVIVLAPSAELGRQWQYRIEDRGEDWRCSPVSSAAQAVAQLQEWQDVLLLLPCAESRALLRMLLQEPPLSPPLLLGEGAPDGPLVPAEALPEMLRRRRQEGCLPSLAAHHLPAAADMARALLRTLGVPGRLRAWAFLPEMAAMTVVHPPLLQDLQHGLYPMIAQRYGMTAAGVERSLRLCVESTWMHGSLSALERFFGNSVDPERGKPTNREFLCRVQERLALAMQRLV
ncbi:MAG: sporulation initiation factor Spo0A C-terminal domain-containing protein [Clostridia bacterium]|nr:sporulation initiation factor Spo0A C-terminal domain-containing protein [Clostridia bacterium]